MKRYLLFGYDQYYPNGGGGDVMGDFDTLEEVKKYIKDTMSRDYYNVLDMQERLWIDFDAYDTDIYDK